MNGGKCIHLSDHEIYWYVLFVQTGSEERLIKRLKESLNCEDFIPFVPKKTCVFRRQGKKSLFQKTCFPGYVFIESSKQVLEFTKHVYPITKKLEEAYRFLSYGDYCDIAMHEEERIALSKIFGNDYCIDISFGFQEGDSIRIETGSLTGYESKIIKINKGRREAIIALRMFGNIIPVSVGFEIIEKMTARHFCSKSLPRGFAKEY